MVILDRATFQEHIISFIFNFEAVYDTFVGLIVSNIDCKC